MGSQIAPPYTVRVTLNEAELPRSSLREASRVCRAGDRSRRDVSNSVNHWAANAANRKCHSRSAATHVFARTETLHALDTEGIVRSIGPHVAVAAAGVAYVHDPRGDQKNGTAARRILALALVRYRDSPDFLCGVPRNGGM
jgi:hypothetical protein